MLQFYFPFSANWTSYNWHRSIEVRTVREWIKVIFTLQSWVWGWACDLVLANEIQGEVSWSFPSRLKTDPPKKKAVAPFLLVWNAHIGLKDCLELLSSLTKENTRRTAELTKALSFGRTDKPSMEPSVFVYTSRYKRERMPLLFKYIGQCSVTCSWVSSWVFCEDGIEKLGTISWRVLQVVLI